MKSSSYTLYNSNSFYPRFITGTILMLTILGVTVNHCVAVNNNTALTAVKNSNTDQHYDAAVSTFITCFTSASYSRRININNCNYYHHYRDHNSSLHTLKWTSVEIQLREVMRGVSPNMASLGAGRAKVETAVL